MNAAPEIGFDRVDFLQLNKGTELEVSLITTAKVVVPDPGISRSEVRSNVVNPSLRTLEEVIEDDAANCV